MQWIRRMVGPVLPAAVFLLPLLPTETIAQHPRAPERGEPLVNAELMMTVPAETGRLLGFVRDGETGSGIAGANIAIEGPEERAVMTNEEGYFRLELLSAGRYTVRAEHLAYATVEVEVEVAGGNQTTHVQIRLLSEAIALEPITVTVEGARPTFGPLARAYERVDRQRMLGLGRILMREDLDRRVVQRLSDLLQPMAGVRIERDEEQDFRARMTGGAHRLREPCYAALFVDGVRMLPPRGGEGSIDEFVTVNELEIVEVYRGAAQIPPEYGGTDAQCGVVAVWTRRVW